MALGILTQDIIVDEPSGLTDGHVDPSATPRSPNTTLKYLISREGPGGLTSPEVTFQADFAQATARAGKPSPASRPPSTWMASVIIGNRDCETGTPRRNGR
ncbi:hypothetical protein RFN28_32385 [Mesorhizobium sp. VK24D]|uniref:Uncharacterized protein n=1 Tax=Mesorhizobium album TaxID=3072314 RepID=A0ABU4Y862_9HYPH|nr:hypothetical protein [Mesorhizobium sp. VK24D]MDX8483115.1 hypothetical protein [Mesorhizobium sp. VK24D]